jgi:hypothetical protein
MGRIWIAIRLFFRALFNGEFAEQGGRLLEAPAALPAPVLAKPAGRPAPRVEPTRSEAVTLLSVLQRESRLIDFLKEDIAGFNDAQVGAAVRDVHRDAGGVLERLFSLRPVMTEPEGSNVQVAAGADAGRVRLIGNVTGQPPYRGTLRHQGWEATKTQLPEWTGAARSANVVAPAEVELK